jgi:hypothetical protein
MKSLKSIQEFRKDLGVLKSEQMSQVFAGMTQYTTELTQYGNGCVDENHFSQEFIFDGTRWVVNGLKILVSKCQRDVSCT